MRFAMIISVLALLAAMPAFAAEGSEYNGEQTQSAITKGTKSYQKPAAAKDQTAAAEDQKPWEVEPAAGVEKTEEETEAFHEKIRLPRKN